MYFWISDEVTNYDYLCYLIKEFLDLYFSNLLRGFNDDRFDIDKVSSAFS